MAYQELTRQYLDLILEENQRSTQDLDTSDVDILIQDIKTAKRIFFMGTGRSGLALRMAAMRLMHIGLAVFIVGDTLTPAILEGDILLAASGSGNTPSVINVVEKAISQKAKVTVLTASLESKLAQLADPLCSGGIQDRFWDLGICTIRRKSFRAVGTICFRNYFYGAVEGIWSYKRRPLAKTRQPRIV